jgi:hypothetical protein
LVEAGDQYIPGVGMPFGRAFKGLAETRFGRVPLSQRYRNVRRKLTPPAGA